MRAGFFPIVCFATAVALSGCGTPSSKVVEASDAGYLRDPEIARQFDTLKELLGPDRRSVESLLGKENCGFSLPLWEPPPSGWYCLSISNHAPKTQPARIGVIVIVEYDDQDIVRSVELLFDQMQKVSVGAAGVRVRTEPESATWELNFHFTTLISELKQRKEGRPNQALQTTPMTRSVCEKTIEFGHPQRGV